MIAAKGHVATDLFIITSGTCQLKTGDSGAEGVLGAGAFFGLECLSGHHYYCSTVTVAAQCPLTCPPLPPFRPGSVPVPALLLSLNFSAPRPPPPTPVACTRLSSPLPCAGTVWAHDGAPNHCPQVGLQTGPVQTCIRRRGTPGAVGQAVGGSCQSGWGRLLSVTNAIEAGTCRQVDSSWAYAGRPGAWQCVPDPVGSNLGSASPNSHLPGGQSIGAVCGPATCPPACHPKRQPNTTQFQFQLYFCASMPSLSSAFLPCGPDNQG